MGDEADRRRGPGRRWQAGETGNPLGRPKIGSPRHLASLRRIALRTLREIAQDPEQPATARVSAANALLNRSDGRPPAAADIPTADPAIVSAPEQERLAKIAALREAGGSVVYLTRADVDARRSGE